MPRAPVDIHIRIHTRMACRLRLFQSELRLWVVGGGLRGGLLLELRADRRLEGMEQAVVGDLLGGQFPTAVRLLLVLVVLLPLDLSIHHGAGPTLTHITHIHIYMFTGTHIPIPIHLRTHRRLCMSLLALRYMPIRRFTLMGRWE